MIFVNKSWHADPRVGCSQPFDSVSACKAKTLLSKKLDAKFKRELERKKSPNRCDM
jgi:hypothetical protein